jgi:hypothetical protein
VEIKAPYSRDPDETEFIYKDYYPQMQIQMEVCDLDAVDFTEAIFGQCHVSSIDEETKAAVSAARWKGYIRVVGTLEDSTTWKYEYTPPVEDLEDATLPNTDVSILETSVWWLKHWYPRTVLRNRVWWETVGLPAAELFWAQVLSGREAAATAANAANAETNTVVPSEGWQGSSS